LLLQRYIRLDVKCQATSRNFFAFFLF
jgi:hypothetical protein